MQSGKGFLIKTEPPSHHKSDLIKGAINTNILVELMLRAMAEYPSQVDLSLLNRLIDEKFSQVLLKQEKIIIETDNKKPIDMVQQSMDDAKGSKIRNLDEEQRHKVQSEGLKIGDKKPVDPTDMVQQSMDDAKGSKIRNLDEEQRHEVRRKGIQAFQQVDQDFREIFNLDAEELDQNANALLSAYKKLIKAINKIWEINIRYTYIAENQLKLNTKGNGDFYFKAIFNFSISKKLQDEIVNALIQNIPSVLTREKSRSKVREIENKLFLERINQFKNTSENPWNITVPEVQQAIPRAQKIYKDYIDIYGTFPAHTERLCNFFNGCLAKKAQWGETDAARSFALVAAMQMHSDCVQYVNDNNQLAQEEFKAEEKPKKENSTFITIEKISFLSWLINVEEQLKAKQVVPKDKKVIEDAGALLVYFIDRFSSATVIDEKIGIVNVIIYEDKALKEKLNAFVISDKVYESMFGKDEIVEKAILIYKIIKKTAITVATENVSAAENYKINFPQNYFNSKYRSLPVMKENNKKTSNNEATKIPQEVGVVIKH